MSHENTTAVIAMPGDESLAATLAARLGARLSVLEFRRFPDGESYLRLDDSLDGRSAVLVARLDRPDAKIPALLFAADLARDLGAAGVGLVAPYLPYMRQDIRFQPGEALTSASFARWISSHFDWLVTVDPHLHRYDSLDEIYSIPSTVVPAAPALADWIAANVDRPVVIGPDAESAQWVEAVAVQRNLPWQVMRKQRFGDHDVRVTAPDLSGLGGHTPVLVDDIVSSGATLARAAELLTDAGLASPRCAVVHGLFGARSRETLAAAGIERLVCTDSVLVDEGEIELAPLLAAAVANMLE
ncbi:MAG TPA: ribose-phosphate diphosphokinase [Wenzhouxiangellaceae bacterium]|nr:ribose-phosphate diphosphokinase [Wenzhouxiangellaceae bacterium]